MIDNWTCRILAMLAVPLVVSLSGAASGCYRYVSSATPPKIGSHVEITLNKDAEAGFRARGVNFVEYFTTGSGALDGIVLQRTDDSLLLQIASVQFESFGERTLYQHVALAHTDLVRVRQRTHNSAATLAVVGISAAIVTLGILEVLKIGSEDCSTTLQLNCR